MVQPSEVCLPRNWSPPCRWAQASSLLGRATVCYLPGLCRIFCFVPRATDLLPGGCQLCTAWGQNQTSQSLATRGIPCLQFCLSPQQLVAQPAFPDCTACLLKSPNPPQICRCLCASICLCSFWQPQASFAVLDLGGLTP